MGRKNLIERCWNIKQKVSPLSDVIMLSILEDRDLKILSNSEDEDLETLSISEDRDIETLSISEVK